MNSKNVLINGESTKINAQTLQNLLTELDIQTNHVAVAINDTVIPSAEYGNTDINNDDHIEIIQPVSGG